MLPLLLIATSLVTGLVIFFLRGEQVALRSLLNMTGAGLKLLLVIIIFFSPWREVVIETRLAFVPGLELVLRVDDLSFLFVSLSAVLWFFTTLYAIGYLEGAADRSRFFGFFSLCVTATMGIALAGNLITLLIFYELLTLTTYPLVVHRGSEGALRAGRTYLLYTIPGGAALLLAAVWLHVLAGPGEFIRGGFVLGLVDAHAPALTAIFVLALLGFGVKAALVGLHGWLPVAMVAPAPVSALLHAVAVVKAGVYGITRLVYDTFGVEATAALGLGAVLVVLASVTIVYGSVLALRQDDLKRRLAYSTVSQLSYITLGVALLTPVAATGGLVHLVHQGLMKVTLFFAAGIIAETLHLHRISELDGVGRRLPLSMLAFTVAAFGMIGLPPLAGFVSKWYLGLGGLEAGAPWVVGVLVVSGLLNAAYFLPVVWRLWFGAPLTPWPKVTGLEAPWTLLVPTLATAAMALYAGLLAASPLSPLALAKEIVMGIFP